jgi:hypothetical protein
MNSLGYQLFHLDAAENEKSCQHCVNKSGGDRWREFALFIAK